MVVPHNLRLNVNACIDHYKERHKPSAAIVNENSYLELKSGGFIIPDAQDQEKRYLLHENGKKRIEIHFLEDLSGKERTMLEGLMADKKLPIVLCSGRLIDNFKNPQAYDLAIPHEELERILKEKTEPQ